MSKKLNKVCVICGDRASGFNFNAITCESCKAFFRRNAPKEKLFRCLRGGVCEIDTNNRKYCKKCRMNKCFAKGMRTELILTEEQKEKRKIKIKENKETKIIEEITKIGETETSVRVNGTGFELVEYNSRRSESETDSQYSSSDSNEIPENLYREAVELEFAVIPFERPIANTNGFNELEISRLKELIDAMTALQCPNTTTITVTDNLNEALRILCIKCDSEVRKIVKMSKKLRGFRSINERDQLILLKHSAIRIIALRLAEYFDLNGHHWRVIIDPNNANIIQLDLLKRQKRKYHQDLLNFYNKFLPEWESDSYIIDLLTAIILFDPKRPRLNQIEPIKFQRNIYMYLLQRYLQIKYQTDSDSITKFLRLLNTLNDLHIIDEKLSKNWSESDASTVSGRMALLKEISNRNND